MIRAEGVQAFGPAAAVQERRQRIEDRTFTRLTSFRRIRSADHYRSRFCF